MHQCIRHEPVCTCLKLATAAGAGSRTLGAGHTHARERVDPPEQDRWENGRMGAWSRDPESPTEGRDTTPEPGAGTPTRTRDTTSELESPSTGAESTDTESPTRRAGVGSKSRRGPTLMRAGSWAQRTGRLVATVLDSGRLCLATPLLLRLTPGRVGG
jgi:hypothetical protein